MIGTRIYSSQKSSKGNSFTFLRIPIVISMMLMSCMSYKLVPGLSPKKSEMVSLFRKGDLLKLYLTNHEVVKKFKVTEIDAIKISGVQKIKTDRV